MRNKNFKAFAFAVLLPLSAFSQVNFSSPFNIFGLGEMSGDEKTWQRSMGGTGIALRDPYQINLLNPAAVSSYEMTTLNIDARHRYVWQSGRGTDDVLLNQNTQVMSFDLGMRLTNWWSASLNLSPFASPNYDIRTLDSVADFGQVLYRFAGGGNINKLTVSNGFKPHKNFSIGFNTHFLFGTIFFNNDVIFDDLRYLSSQKSDNLRYKDVVFDIGAQYHALLGKRYFLVVGATYTPGQNLNSTYTQRYSTFRPGSQQPSIDTAIFQVNDIKTTRLQSQIGVGFSLSKISERTTMAGWTLTGDYRINNGSEYVHFNGTNPLHNGYSANFGASITPRHAFSKLDRGRSYFNDITVRAGGYYMQTPIMIEGNPIIEQGLSFGLSLPFRPRNLGPGEQKLNHFNIGIVVGNRGNGNTDLINEDFVHLNFGVVFSDRWFRKFKYR